MVRSQESDDRQWERAAEVERIGKSSWRPPQNEWCHDGTVSDEMQIALFFSWLISSKVRLIDLKQVCSEYCNISRNISEVTLLLFCSVTCIDDSIGVIFLSRLWRSKTRMINTVTDKCFIYWNKPPEKQRIYCNWKITLGSLGRKMYSLEVSGN